jgi:MinD superfamily P-loop ATPase
VDWSGTDVLVVDMPPRTGEEARGLLQLRPSIAVVATAPQLISESAVRKVVEMASEYRLPLLGFVENQHNGVTGKAGHRLATHYGLPLLVQIPWSPDISMSMDVHEPFDHQEFLPVAEALTARLFPAPEVKSPQPPRRVIFCARPRPGLRVKNGKPRQPPHQPLAYL